MSETTNNGRFRDEATRIILLKEYEEVASKNTADAMMYLQDKKDNEGFSKADLKSVFKISDRIWKSLSSKTPPSNNSKVTRQRCTELSKRFVRNFLSTLAADSIMKSTLNDLFEGFYRSDPSNKMGRTTFRKCLQEAFPGRFKKSTDYARCVLSLVSMSFSHSHVVYRQLSIYLLMLGHVVKLLAHLSLPRTLRR